MDTKRWGTQESDFTEIREGHSREWRIEYQGQLEGEKYGDYALERS